MKYKLLCMITIIVTSLFTFTLTYATDQDTPVIEDPVANYVYAIQASGLGGADIFLDCLCS